MLEYILFLLISLLSTILFALSVGALVQDDMHKSKKNPVFDAGKVDFNTYTHLEQEALKEPPVETGLNRFEIYRQAAKIAGEKITEYAKEKGVKLKKLIFGYDRSDPLKGDKDMKTPGYALADEKTIVINSEYASSLYDKAKYTIEDLAKKLIAVGYHEVQHVRDKYLSEGMAHGKAMADMIKAGYDDTVSKIQDWMKEINPLAYSQSNDIIYKELKSNKEKRSYSPA